MRLTRGQYPDFYCVLFAVMALTAMSYFHLSMDEETFAQGALANFDSVLETSMLVLAAGREMKYDKFDKDAKLLYQMTVVRCHSLINFADGFTFGSISASFGVKKSYDPFSMDAVIRSILESYSWFNHLYRQHSGKEQLLLKKIWLFIGIKEHLGFPLDKPDGFKIYKAGLSNSINQDKLFRSLSNNKRKVIKRAIDNFNFRIKFENGIPRIISWQEMFTAVGINKDVLQHMYARLSATSHPTRFAVSQFDTLYKSSKHRDMVMLGYHFAGTILAFFIADYCYLFPHATDTFRKLPKKNQIIVNLNNINQRGKKFAITPEFVLL